MKKQHEVIIVEYRKIPLKQAIAKVGAGGLLL